MWEMTLGVKRSQKHTLDAVILFAKLRFLMKPRQCTPLLELPAPTLTMTHAQFGEGSFGTVMVAALGGTEVAAKHCRRQDAAVPCWRVRTRMWYLTTASMSFKTCRSPKPVSESLTVSAL